MRSELPSDFPLAQDHTEVDSILIQVFAALSAGDAHAALSELDRFWARLAVHIRAEHMALFPAIIDTRPETREKVLALRNDHDFFMKELADLIKTLRLAAGNSVVDLGRIASRLSVVRDRLQAHNRLEEADIYPLAKTFDSRVLDRIDSELNNLPPRFANNEQ